MIMTNLELVARLESLLAAPRADTWLDIRKLAPLVDIVDVLNGFDDEALLSLLIVLPSEQRTELFTELDSDRQDRLLGQLPQAIVANLFETMRSDERADLYNRLSETDKAALLPTLAHLEREDIVRLAAFAEGTVGSVTTSDYASVEADSSVREALDTLRISAPDKETIYVIYVLDQARSLLGTLSLRQLVLARPDGTVRSIMTTEPVHALASWPKQELPEIFRRYDLLAIPVVGGDDKMLGIVTVDDAMDIEKELDATQLARFGGTAVLAGEDLDLRQSPTMTIYKTRVFWLALLTVFGVITSTYVAAQEDLLMEVLVLAAFVAPIIDMGGNTGSQSATLVIRAMAIGDIRLSWRDIWFVVRREIPVAIALGVTIAVLEAILAYLSKGVGYEVLLVVGLSMMAVTIIGGIFGAVLPFMARKIGTDPATLSAPMITSVMDLLGVFIYFAIAYAFLGHLLV
jgi:magnesium transporter